MIAEEKYCRKLISIIFDQRYTDERFNNLFMHLYSCDFIWPRTILGDSNRAADGIQLRKDLGFFDILQDKPCSILEMLIALSLRMENDYAQS